MDLPSVNSGEDSWCPGRVQLGSWSLIHLIKRHNKTILIGIDPEGKRVPKKGLVEVSAISQFVLTKLNGLVQFGKNNTVTIGGLYHNLFHRHLYAELL